MSALAEQQHDFTVLGSSFFSISVSFKQHFDPNHTNRDIELIRYFCFIMRAMCSLFWLENICPDLYVPLVPRSPLVFFLLTLGKFSKNP